MQYLVPYNYSMFTVDEGATDDYISVMVSSIASANYKYGGVISARDASLNEAGTFTFFKLNPSFRDSSLDKWQHTSDNSTLLAYCLNGRVFIVIDDTDRYPVFTVRDYIDFDTESIRFTNNVFDFTSIRNGSLS